MSSNLTYLDPALQPLADAAQAYLDAEKELQRAEVAAATAQQAIPRSAATEPFEQRSATGSYPQHHDEAQHALLHLRGEVARLRQAVLALLPVRDEWVKINLGYGPSRVGAFRAAAAPAPDAAPTTTDDYTLRVVV